MWTWEISCFLALYIFGYATQVHDGWNSTNSDLLAIWRRREGAREHKGQFPRGQLCYCCWSKGYFAFYAMSPEEVVLCVQMHTQDGQYFMHSNSKFSINCSSILVKIKFKLQPEQYSFSKCTSTYNNVIKIFFILLGFATKL